MKKFASGFILLMILCSLLVSLVEIGIVKAESTIYIRTDGNVEGTDKIQRDGNVYIFTGEILDSIVVERDNVVIDGAGYTLHAGDLVGIKIIERNNITVRNLVIREFLGSCGILLIDSNDCNIYQNNITNNFKGIEMTGSSSRNNIFQNQVQNNQVGIELYSINPGSDNTISENEIINNNHGITAKDFLNTSVIGNNITTNESGIGLGLGSGSILRNNTVKDNTYGFHAFNVPAVNIDIDTSNTVNGKPIYFWVNQHDRTVPTDAGYVALIGCNNIMVENLNLSGNTEGIFLGSTTNSTIINNKLSNNVYGTNLDTSFNNTISGNIITNNRNGIGLRYGSSNNTIYGNEITANSKGIFIAEASGNSIVGNNITNSDNGINTQYSGINTIHHNNFINNTKHWHDIVLDPFPNVLPVSVSIWDDGKEGNYWDDYSGVDNNGDGVGDSPYVIGENNQDNYPLVEAYIIPEFPSGTPLLLILIVLAVAVAIYKRRLLKTPIH